jgi:hypothetical protein
MKGGMGNDNSYKRITAGSRENRELRMSELITDLPPTQDLKALIHEEHNRAELQRLRMGLEGYGYVECQELYRTLGLSVYGNRVIQYSDLIFVQAGKDGADLFEDSRDYWTTEGFFVQGSKKYGTSPSGGIIYLGTATEMPPNGAEKSPEKLEVVTKRPDKGISPTNNIQNCETGIMLQEKKRGRPRKQDGDPVSRMTQWRRRKEADVQGVLLT